ncbi:MAG TPA: DUF58 domain-containing protein [Acidobacteriota bacterium]|jgi:uncharacterized protein (DUF58 family)
MKSGLRSDEEERPAPPARKTATLKRESRIHRTGSWRSFVPGSIVLAVALTAALASSAAARSGNPLAATVLAMLALVLAMLSSLMLIPKLLENIRWEFLGSAKLFSFTGQGVFVTFLIVVVTLAAVNTGNNLLFLIVSTLLVSYLISGILAKLTLSGLAIGYRFPDYVYASRPSQFLWTLRNEKRWVPTFSLRAETHLEGSDGSEYLTRLYFPFLDGERTLSQGIQFTFPTRGVYRISYVNLMTRFPFGFFQRGKVLNPEREVLVYPEIVPIDDFAHLLPFLQGDLESFRKGQGEGLYQIREYQSTDGIRQVHWRSTAKTGRLMVRDFSRVEEKRVCICLDNTRLHEKFERAITLAASIASHFHDEGAQVQLMTAGGASILDRPRREQLVEILEMLARLEVASPEAVFWDLIPKYIGYVRPDEVFKIVITPAVQGSVPGAVWRTSHVVFFNQL